jgi:hypothetical protein
MSHIFSRLIPRYISYNPAFLYYFLSMIVSPVILYLLPDRLLTLMPRAHPYHFHGIYRSLIHETRQ